LETARQRLAQTAPEVIHLWPNGAPGFEARKDEPETAKDWWVKNIHNPSVAVFRPPAGTANGCAVVVAPGGGFRELVFNAEVVALETKIAEVSWSHAEQRDPVKSYQPTTVTDL